MNGNPARAHTSKKRSRREASYYSFDEEDAQAPLPRKPRGSRPRKTPKEPEQELEKWGDYTLKYQDDETGSRNIHPAALRFTLDICQDLARETTASVAKSLKDDGELVRLVVAVACHSCIAMMGI